MDGMNPLASNYWKFFSFLNPEVCVKNLYGQHKTTSYHFNRNARNSEPIGREMKESISVMINTLQVHHPFDETYPRRPSPWNLHQTSGRREGEERQLRP